MKQRDRRRATVQRMKWRRWVTIGHLKFDLGPGREVWGFDVGFAFKPEPNSEEWCTAMMYMHENIRALTNIPQSLIIPAPRTAHAAERVAPQEWQTPKNPLDARP